MKKILLILAASLVAGSAFASDSASGRISDDEHCAAISTLADAIMHGRQGTMKMVEMREHFSAAPGPFKGAVEMMIDDAYSHPRWATENAKNEAKIEFSNKWYKTCLDARRK